MPDMNLSEEEARWIEERRAEREAAEKRQAEKLQILKTAYQYEQWLQENGAGSTYSTFCDDFGYGGEHREFMFKAVNQIRSLAHDEAG